MNILGIDDHGRNSSLAFQKAHETVVERLVRAVFARRILPAATGLDDKNNPADDAVIVNPGYAMRIRKVTLDTVKLISR